jgi:hypothetical protein
MKEGRSQKILGTKWRAPMGAGGSGAQHVAWSMPPRALSIVARGGGIKRQGGKIYLAKFRKWGKSIFTR